MLFVRAILSLMNGEKRGYPYTHLGAFVPESKRLLRLRAIISLLIVVDRDNRGN